MWPTHLEGGFKGVWVSAGLCRRWPTHLGQGRPYSGANHWEQVAAIAVRSG